jgi:hypothetical protein
MQSERDREEWQRAAESLLFWIAAFAYAFAIFLLLLPSLKGIPATPFRGVGAVTVAGASKLRDYVSALLFFTLVPLLTVAVERGVRALFARLAPAAAGSRRRLAAAALFALPFWLAPFFYLTTRKEVWGAVLPIVLGAGAAYAVHLVPSRPWLAGLLRRELAPIHALLLTEAAAWILGRSLTTGKLIAHIPTLLLEVVFIALFALLFWSAAIAASRAATLLFGGEGGRWLARIAFGATPLLVLPLLPLARAMPPALPLVLTLGTIVTTLAALLLPVERWGRFARGFVAFVAVPLLLFLFSYTSTAGLSPMDLFHRGESLGPASDYLRGKIPYRDVFVLHGMLENGLLDAQLMKLFGRSAGVGLVRLEILSAAVLPMIWLLGIVLFRSMPLALATVALSLVTSAENQRAILEIVVVILVVAALRGRRGAAFAAGAVAALALFFSLDIGIYSLGGGVATFVAASALVRLRRAEMPGARPLVLLALFAAGAAVGAAPFVSWLAAHGALEAFARDSFGVVPSIIDSVWSVPFPKLGRIFKSGISLQSLADFALGEPIRFVLNPLVIGVALVYLLRRVAGRRVSLDDTLLLGVTLFALLTQRSALGRADFPHQYFAAFLIAPIVVALAIRLAAPVRRLVSDSHPAAAIAATALVLLPLPAVMTALWVPDLVSHRLENTIGFRARMAAGAPVDAAAAEVADRAAAVSAEVRRLVPPGEPIFDFSNQPAFYFLADRPNPTRFYQVPVISPPDLQLEAITALERGRPRLVLRRSPQHFDRFDSLPNDVRAAALARYLDERYVFARSVRGVEIWLRNPYVPPLASVEPYRALANVRPQPQGEWERVYFPGAGSIVGALGEQWTSDLLVYNAARFPVELRLRYLSASGNREAAVIAQPGRAELHRDVVVSMFALPESSGALEIECRGPCPDLRLRNADARKGGGSFQPPLTAADAAHAGSRRPLLSITGATGGEGRRINIGVVNLSLAPARFRVALYDEGGHPAGEAIESTLAEGESMRIADAERAMHASIRETTLVEIAMIEGSALAWASVIDGATGQHELLMARPGEAR